MNTSYKVKDCYLINIPTYTDDRGSISVIDRELPFIVKRVFWLHNIKKGQSRGGHALLEGTEIICALHGSFTLELFDGVDITKIEMNDPSVGVLIRPGIWFFTHSYKYDGVSLILSDEEYSRDRYIYDFEKYQLMKKG